MPEQMLYGVFDYLTRTFVTDKSGQWLFNSWERADAERQYEHARINGGSVFLLVAFQDQPESADDAAEVLSLPR